MPKAFLIGTTSAAFDKAKFKLCKTQCTYIAVGYLFEINACMPLNWPLIEEAPL
jgi:hypothetical protein